MGPRCAAFGLLGVLACGGCVLSAGVSSGGDAGGDADGSAGAPDAGLGSDAAPECAPPDSMLGLLRAVRTPTPPLLDGSPEEDIWRLASTVEFENPSRSDNAVTVSALWSDTSLYLAWTVVDESLELEGTELYRDDGTELYLDIDHDETADLEADDYHLVTNYQDENSGALVSLTTATRVDGYSQEMSIPWEESGVVGPTEGQILGLLLGNNDRDDGASVQFDWLGIIESGDYDRPNLWGDLELGPAPPANCTD